MQSIIHQNDGDWQPIMAVEFRDEALSARKAASRQRHSHEEACYRGIVEHSGSELSRRLEQLRAKGALSWLTAMPINEFGFHLSKRDFRDALALRYGWHLCDVPAVCTCGKAFTPMCCATGGFPTMGSEI